MNYRGVRILSLQAAIIYLAYASTFVESFQTINWGKCPPGQLTSSYKMDCANLSFHLNYDNPAMGYVTAFIRRQYVNTPTLSAIWCVAGGPGDSTYGFPPICDYFIGSNSSFTCYSQDARGTGLSSYMSCGENQPVGPFNPYNTTSVNSYKNCFQNIVDNYGTDVQYYSTYNAQRDLLGAIQAINPNVVHIYAQSFGTYAINTYLQLPGARADAVVLDGPVPPNRWPLENNAEWTSQVAQDVAYGCASNSSVCSARISAMGHIPKLVMDSIVDGTLPCLRNLPWLRASDGQFWASIYCNWCTSQGGGSRVLSHVCLSPFWYRLYRCSASDITQLNFFNAYQQVALNQPVSALEYSLGVAITIGVSELYSYSSHPLSYSEQVQRSARMFASAATELVVSYARNVTDFPRYEVNSTVYMKFAKPTVPVLILVGTYDANTENGLGFWYQQGLGSMATLLNVPYNSHITLSADDYCVDSIVLNFFESLGKSYNTQCLKNFAAPDWDGSSQAVRNYSMQIFGTTDLWNDNYALDVPSSSCTTTYVTTIVTNPSSCSNCFRYSIAVVVCVIIIIALIAYIIYLRNKKLSKYDSIPETPTVEQSLLE